ncbi:hypothetical protein IAT38_008121 [Cryptococcus sp. DSM 104549]
MVFPFGRAAQNDPPPPANPPIPNGATNTAGPPPRYATVVRKVYPYSLRPIVIFISIVGFIYGLALGVESIRDMNNDKETTKMKIFDLIIGIMFLVIALIELFCIAVAAMQSLPLARILLVAVPVGVLVNFGAQILAIVVHFSLKSDLIAQCVYDETGATYSDRFGTTGNITETQAQSVCDSSWSRGTWGVFAWLIITACLSVLFASTMMSYYHQLRDPSSVRERTPRGMQNQNQAFPMQPGYYPPPPANGQQPWMVPPYPGPPANAPPPPGPGYEKSDYQPDAPWAQAEYDAPHGAPPGNSTSGGFGVSANRAEDEAWERAQASGVTAHLTGHGAGRPRDVEQEARGYTIRNEEEDEAWERARNEGVTAHLTGAGTSRPGRGDGVV